MDWAQESGRAALFHPLLLPYPVRRFSLCCLPTLCKGTISIVVKGYGDQGKQPSRQSAGPDDCASASDAVSQLLATNESPGRMFLFAR